MTFPALSLIGFLLARTGFQGSRVTYARFPARTFLASELNGAFRIGLDYYFVVYAREDVVAQITDVTTLVDLQKFVSNVKVVDAYGAFRVYDQSTPFVHPGNTVPTSFDFDAKRYLDMRKTAVIRAAIAPLPDETVLRGGGTVKLTVSDGSKVIAEKVLKPGLSMKIPLAATTLHFSADHDGNPDSNRLLICFDTKAKCGIDKEHVRDIGALDKGA